MEISKNCRKHPLLPIALKYCESIGATAISYITVFNACEFRVMYTNKNGIGEAKILNYEAQQSGEIYERRGQIN